MTPLLTNTVLLIALGGAVGAVFRFSVNQITIMIFGEPIYWATLMVNALGCLLMGMAYSYLLQKDINQEFVRSFFMIGLFGAFTTWSTFSMETVVMMQNNEWFKALSYTMLTVGCCFIAFWLGTKA